MRSIPNITGGLVRGRQGRAMAAAMRDMQNADALDHGDISTSPQHGRFLGRIVAKGPNGEADFTDARYWVQPGNIQGGKVGDAIDFKDNKNFKQSIFPVTNLPEWKQKSHALQGGTAVAFSLAWDRGNPNRPHWIMEMPWQQWVHAYVIGFEVGNGRYTVTYPADGKFNGEDPTTNHAYPDGSDTFVTTTVNAVMDNLAESRTGSKILTPGSIVPAYFWGFTKNETPVRPVLRCYVGGPGIAFVVNLSQNGGAAAGSPTTYASWTYIVTHQHNPILAGATNNPTLSVGATPGWRPKGATTPATFGLAAYGSPGQPATAFGVSFGLIVAYET